ncbi:hypothetical protein COOONC_10566 [Cooperia oncophora]
MTAKEPAKARRQDVWRANHTCMKLLIYDFFAKEVPTFQPFSGSSVLVKRHVACGERYVGLECLHEFHFSFATEPWWACSICYESGALMEQADMHLASLSHITTYLDEFHSHKMSKLKLKDEPLKVFEEVKRICDEIFEEEGVEYTPPECIAMDASITKGTAMAKLAVDTNRCRPSYTLHTDCTSGSKEPRKILQCLVGLMIHL